MTRTFLRCVTWLTVGFLIAVWIVFRMMVAI